MDILQATLASGIRVQKFVPSYGDQPNDVVHVVKCKISYTWVYALIPDLFRNNKRLPR